MRGELILLRPWWLLAMLPVIALCWLQFRRMRGGRAVAGWSQVVDAHLRSAILTIRPGAGKGQTALVVACATLAVIALCGPALSSVPATFLRSDAARVLVVELSPAMDATDLAPSRLARARYKLLDWLDSQVGSGETALVVYAAEPYLVAPLTTDSATLALFVPEFDTAVMPLAGNAPGPALDMAAALLDASVARHREIVWLTSGAGSGDIDAIAAEIGAAGIALSVLHFARENDQRLREALVSHGGRYALVRSDGDDLRELGATDAHGPLQSVSAPASLAPPRDLGPWFLLPLAALAAIGLRGVLPAMALCMSMSLGLNPGETRAAGIFSREAAADREAREFFAAGDFDAAAARFEDPRWRAAALYRAGRHEEAAAALEHQRGADDLYNLGNALMHLRRYREALHAFEFALEMRPDDDDFLHNRDLAKALISPPPQDDEAEGPEVSEQSSQHRPSPTAADQVSAPEREAAMLAEQWLSQLHDDPGGLLRRKLLLEHRRRHPEAGTQR